MVKYIFCFLFLSGLLACRHFNLLNGENPTKSSFKYYNKNFKFSATSNIRLNRKYYYKYPDNKVNVLVFFNDGFLNSYYTSSVDSVSDKRAESGVTMGYFETRNDSIFFTTKSYYQPKATFYRGRIINEALELKVKYPNRKDTLQEKYSLY